MKPNSDGMFVDPIGRGKSGPASAGPSATTDDLLNKLGKWRQVFTGWQLGTRQKGDPEADAVRDHRELTMMMRVELNTLVGLLIEKGVFTLKEWDTRQGIEAAHYDKMLEEKFPGIYTTLDGVTYTQKAAETMRGWIP